MNCVGNAWGRLSASSADLVEERRRRLVLEREVRELLTKLAAYEANQSSARVEHHA